MTAMTLGAAGAMGAQVQLDNIANHSALVFAPTPSAVSAGFKFKTDGTAWETVGSGFSVPTDDTDLSPNYFTDEGGLEIRCTSVSGSAPNGGSTVGSWLALSTERHFYQTLSGTGFQIRSGVVRFEIRRGSTVVATSADVTLAVTLDV